MTFFHKLRCTLCILLLLLALSSAQQCYYPDGSTSDDVPCSDGGDSSCCGADSFCMDNGLCFGGGLVSRGSCTDKSWTSGACTAYCKTGMSLESASLMKQDMANAQDSDSL